MKLIPQYSALARFVTFSLVLGMCSLLLVSGLSAQTVSFEDCRQIQNTEARYRCYDQLEQDSEETSVERLPVISRPQPVVNTTPSASEPLTEPMPASDKPGNVEAVVRSRQDKKPLYRRIWPFGGEDEEQVVMQEEPPAVKDKVEQGTADTDSFGRGNSQSARVVENDKGEQELRDTVVSVRFYVINKLEITLESGQVWRQADSKPFMLKAGDTVRIYSAFWGDNYRLSNERLKSFIQVRRID